MSDDCRYDGGSSGFMPFIMGAAIGAGLALVFAPRSGEETRQKANDVADDVRERVRKIIDDAEERIKETVDESRENLDEKREVFASAIAAGKEAYEEGQKKHETEGEG